MKAIQVHQFGGPEVLQVCDVELPQLRNDEVLVQVKAAGVNPYDTYMRSGGYGAKNPALPYTPGSDAVAVGRCSGSTSSGNGARSFRKDCSYSLIAK